MVQKTKYVFEDVSRHFSERSLKMKFMLYALVMLALIPQVALCQDSTTSDIVVHLVIPKGWKAEGDSTFVRTNLNQEFAFWHKELDEGHMPWRADPKNIAVTCLWSFGIHDGSPVFTFADRLGVIKKGSIYSFEADSTQYTIYIKSKDYIPIAYKFVLKGLRKTAANMPQKDARH